VLGLAALIRAERVRSGLKIKDLSDASGVSSSQISRIETGKISPLSSQGQSILNALGLRFAVVAEVAKRDLYQDETAVPPEQEVEDGANVLPFGAPSPAAPESEPEPEPNLKIYSADLPWWNGVFAVGKPTESLHGERLYYAPGFARATVEWAENNDNSRAEKALAKAGGAERNIKEWRTRLEGDQVVHRMAMVRCPNGVISQGERRVVGKFFNKNLRSIGESLKRYGWSHGEKRGSLVAPAQDGLSGPCESWLSHWGIQP
jgi:transcriptional regulator with XRE-family HTH domain